jgi:lysophospholipase L1-like esterase
VLKKQLALAGAAFLVSVVLAEVLARLVGINPGYGRLMALGDAPMRTVDGVVLWEDHDSRATPDEIARAAASPDAMIVVGLGDSIMYGVGLEREQTYLELMRHALAGRVQRPIEVLNLAVPGYGTAQEDAVHRELAERLAKPHLVLLHYWSDDGHMYRAVGGYVVDVGDMSPDGRLIVRALPLPAAINDFLLVHSNLYQLLTHAVVTHDRRATSSDWTRVATPLAALSRRVREAGGRLVVLASPELSGDVVRANDELPDLRQLGREHGFDVVDLSEWLDGAPAASVRIDGVHFNAEGHRRIGAHLADYVLAQLAGAPRAGAAERAAAAR